MVKNKKQILIVILALTALLGIVFAPQIKEFAKEKFTKNDWRKTLELDFDAKKAQDNLRDSEGKEIKGLGSIPQSDKVVPKDVVVKKCRMRSFITDQTEEENKFFGGWEKNIFNIHPEPKASSYSWGIHVGSYCELTNGMHIISAVVGGQTIMLFDTDKTFLREIVGLQVQSPGGLVAPQIDGIKDGNLYFSFGITSTACMGISQYKLDINSFEYSESFLYIKCGDEEETKKGEQVIFPKY